MPLNKLENFLKNVEGRILYVSPADLDSTDSILNQGNSQTKPFKTLQRALIEAARFSYNVGRNNDTVEKTTILLMPGEHEVDNRPGHTIRDNEGVFELKKSNGTSVSNETLSLKLETNFDINQEDNVLYKFNSVHGGVIVPRGTSIVGLDLRKTKIRPKYVPNPTDDTVPYSAVFRVTGACYFWQFSIFDGNELGKVYTDDKIFNNTLNQSQPTFSHHKLTCFEYADGVNDVQDTGLTDLDMYYYKLSRAYNTASNRNIAEKFMVNGSGTGLDGFSKQRPEWEIVGAFANDPVKITKIQSGTLPGVPTNQVTVTTQGAHNFSVGTPIKIKGVDTSNYNISTKVASTDPVLDNKFTYVLPDVPQELPTLPKVDGALITIETDTVSGASPYIFNISLRSVWGMNGMHADGSKASGFRSMVVAQFTGVSLQKDDRAFVKYNSSTRAYEGITFEKVKGPKLSSQSSSTNAATVYHLDSDAIYRQDWQTTHVKITNDAILQIVSVFAIGYANHFMAKSGGDASITNSNSNFGQLALVADGFRKDAFKKDDNAFITHIITPKAIVAKEEDIEWVQISTKTRVNNNLDADGNIANPPLPELPSNRLYLFGYSENASDTNDKPHSEDIKPSFLIQGFRIGARVGEKLYAKIEEYPGSGPDGASVADIVMSPSVSPPPPDTSARRTIIVKSVNGIDGTFTTSNAQGVTIPHNLATGEKIIIISDDGDLPEKILEHKVYFAITEDSTNGLETSQLRLALSKSDAENNVAIKNTYCLDAASLKLKITTRVTDKEAGDIGHPIQYDTNEGWYITTNDNSEIRQKIVAQKTAADADPDDDIKPLKKTDISFFFRITDTRSLDDKIFKTRVSIPKEVQNGKNIQNGFILQESSSTNVRTPNDLNFSGNLTASDFGYKRNLRFISNCQFTAGTGGNPGKVTVETERPHNLQDGDLVKIDGIRNSDNTDGASGRGYNIEAKVNVINHMTFRFDAPTTLSTQPTTNFRIDKAGGVGLASSLPRFTRKDLQSNLYFYRNDVVTEYDEGVETGVYHGYQLFADLKVTTEFDENEYGQTVVDLYPQLDRDNQNDTPRAAKSFALRSPLGKVATNDLQKSITRESIDKLLVKFGSAINVKSFVDGGNNGLIRLERDHNLCGIARGVLEGGTSNSGMTNGTYENVKIFNGSVAGNNWSGALGKVTIIGGQINSYEITNPGSGFSPSGTEFGHWDNTVIGGSDGAARLGSASGVALKNENLTSSHENLVMQVTGSGIKEDAYFRTKSIPDPERIEIYKTASDPDITSDQYVFIVGGASNIEKISDSNGTVTVTTTRPHGLEIGNRFQLNDSSNNNLGAFIVSNKTSPTEFKFNRGNTNVSGGVLGGWILKHGLSANDEFSGKGGENLSVRGAPLYGLEEGILTGGLTSPDDSSLSFDLFGSKIGIGVRFPQGSYIQIDDEILRIASFTDSNPDSSSGTITVIRGVFGTRASEHVVGSLVRKLSPIPLELHRYSILRASGHTFEYLGYGPGNYSTALPQVQVKTISEREEFLAQAQERAAGTVVYTGMNDKGDFYIGNSKKSALTGEETTFDNPVPTVAGEDPSRLSVVFDEVTIKERLLVEGGRNNNILSQFDGPVNFNQNVRFGTDARVTIKNETSVEDGGALAVDGGVVIDESLEVGGTGDFDRVTIQKDLRVGIGSTDGEQLDAIVMGQRKHIVFDDKSGLGSNNDGFRIFVNENQNAIIKNAIRQRDSDGNVLYDDEGQILGRDTSITTRVNSRINFGTNGEASTASFVAGGSAILKYAGPVGTGTKLKTIGAGATITGQLHFNPDLSTDPLEDTAIINNAILLPQGRRVGMGTEFKFQIFQNSVGDGRIKHQGHHNLSITVRGPETIDGEEKIRNILISANDGSKPAASFNIGAGVTIYHAGARKLETTGVGATITGQLDFNPGTTNAILLPQGRKLAMGIGNQFQIFENTDGNGIIKHNGHGESEVLEGNISLTVKTGKQINFGRNGATNLAIFTADAGCLLKYNNKDRIETLDDGVKITEELRVTADIIAYFGSDLRLKTDINPIADALNKVKSISGNTFEWNENSTHEGQDTGVIAQEVESLGLPGLVTTRDNGYMAVRYEKIVPLLIEAIKELSDKVDDLEQKLSDK